MTSLKRKPGRNTADLETQIESKQSELASYEKTLRELTEQMHINEEDNELAKLNGQLRTVKQRIIELESALKSIGASTSSSQVLEILQKEYHKNRSRQSKMCPRLFLIR